MIKELHRNLIRCVESEIDKKGSTKVLSLLFQYSFLLGALITIPIIYVIFHQIAIDVIMCIIFVICLSYFHMIVLYVCLKRLVLDLKELEK